jgi:hypothetical protein
MPSSSGTPHTHNSKHTHKNKTKKTNRRTKRLQKPQIKTQNLDLKKRYLKATKTSNKVTQNRKQKEKLKKDGKPKNGE